MADDMTPEESIALIKKNLQEVLNPEIIDDVILKQKRPLVVYWGTATTGRPHCGYFVPMLKIAELLRAGCTVKILLAEIHAMMDVQKAPPELINVRADYYKFAITSLLKAVNVPIERLVFVRGGSYQLTPAYMMDLLKLTTQVSEHDAKRAGAEVVKQVDNGPLSGLLYPLMQTLDEEYLNVDAQFGGLDQRKIFALAKEVLPKIGYKERAHLMNPMVPGLQGGKMSASDPDSKIDLLDGPDVVRRKLKKAVAAPKQVGENGVLSFCEYVLLPAGILKHGKPHFEVPRRNGEETLVYTDIQQMQEDYRNDKLTPQILKPAVTEALIGLLEPIRAEFEASSEWQEIEKKAYPSTKPEDKKKKKEKKDKGSRYPGAGKPADGSPALPERGAAEPTGDDPQTLPERVKE